MRHIVRLLVGAILGIGLTSIGLSPSVGADEPPIKILLIGAPKDGHPYRTHEYLDVCHLLAKCLQQTARVETTVSDGWPTDSSAVADLSAIVLYVPWGSNTLFDGPQREIAQQLLARGVGLSAIHWATGAQGDEYGQLWLDQMGAWFNTQFSAMQHAQKKVHLVDPDSPIANGVSDFQLFDEFYFNLRFADSARPLATIDVDGTSQTIAWTYERPHSKEGRSFGCVGGHYHKNFANDYFRTFLVNGILWTAKVSISPQGAPCRIEPADLQVAPPEAAPLKRS